MGFGVRVCLQWVRGRDAKPTGKENKSSMEASFASTVVQGLIIGLRVLGSPNP